MNTTNIKLISCDLDGTLLNAHGEISNVSKSILLELQEKGYCLVLNSGRFYHEVKPFIEQLNLPHYGGYVICSNGYFIYDCKNNTTHTFDSINYKECINLMNQAKQAHVLTFYYANDTYSICTTNMVLIAQYIGKGLMYFVSPFLPSHYKKYVQMFRNAHVHTHHHIPSFDHVEKLCFIQFPYFIKRIKNSILQSNQGYRLFDVNAFSVEIVKGNVSKADAISYICKQKNFTMEHVLAFGDAGNDIPLLQQAGLGVLMKNAHKHMRVYSDQYTEYDNHEDGVARFLKKYLLEL